MSRPAITSLLPKLQEGSIAHIGLVQINNSFSQQNYFPYSVGILQAYAQAHLQTPGAFDFLLPVYRRLPPAEASRQLTGADAVFFSCYVWNEQISLAIARELKVLRPDILIVFGGPQVPNQAEQFLRSNPCIDVVCHSEGEQAFVAILEQGMYGNWSSVPSISFIDENNMLVNHPPIARIKDFSDAPSPYLSGVFNALMRANPNERWIGVWETNRGCPFSCTFCDWGSAIASKVFSFPMERLQAELEWFALHSIEFIFCADANFGILPRDLEIARYAATIKHKYGYPKALSVQGTKNATDRAYEVQKTLAVAGLNKGVTLSFQSLDATTLESVKRSNISTNAFQELQQLFNRDRIETYSDMILGLPGETYDSFANGVNTLIRNGQHNRIQFNNLSILPNAEMGSTHYQMQHGMLLAESTIVNIHGSLQQDAWDVPERQKLVVATHTMPPDSWVKTRAFCWWAGLIYFDKLLQIPLILLHTLGGYSYRDLFEIFSKDNIRDLPTLHQMQLFFEEKARDIQQGGSEYCPSQEWLNIWWPADEFMLIKLCTENRLDDFYAEVSVVLSRVLCRDAREELENLLHDAIRLNQHLLKRPFISDDITIETSANLREMTESMINGTTCTLTRVPCRYHIDRSSVSWKSWESWCREVVWYGNKKGAYLYGVNAMEPELSGHY